MLYARQVRLHTLQYYRKQEKLMDEIFQHFRYCNMIAIDTNDTSEIRSSLQEMRFRDH